ncbi:MAG TPA: signal peptidase II [Thermoleophilaceae bacterium]
MAVVSVAAAIVLVDQATKALAVRFLSAAAPTAAGGVALLRLAPNRSWWLGGAPTVRALLGLWGLTLGCTALALASATSPSDRIAVAGLVVALGGATSNLLDRVGRGAVIDFISLGRWPAFNLADVAIVAGVVVAAGSVV